MLYLLGLAYSALGRYDDSVESLALAAGRDKPTVEILYRLAEAQWLAGRGNEAIVSAQHALAMDPRHQLSRDLMHRIELAQSPQAPLRR